jgi:NitT/TauT family transport system substrate-binding protein
MSMASFGRIAVLSLALYALGAGTGRAQQEPLENASLAIPAVSLTFSAGYIAEDLHLWAKHGLAVKTVEIAGIGATNAVISGSTDFAEISAASLTRAAAHGQRLLAIASLIDRPFTQIVLRKDLAAAAGFDLRAPLDKRGLALKGRTIAVDAVNTVNHAYLRLVLARAGVEPESVRVAPMEPNSMIAAFAAKQIDGFAMSLPWPLIPVQDGTAVLVASGPDGDPVDMKPLGQNILVTRPDTCEKHRSLCLKMGQSFAEAIRYAHEHPAETTELLQRRFLKFDAKLLAAAFADFLKVSPNPPAMSAANLENAEIFNIDAKLLQPGDKLKSYDGLFTDAYVK